MLVPDSFFIRFDCGETLSVELPSRMSAHFTDQLKQKWIRRAGILTVGGVNLRIRKEFFSNAGWFTTNPAWKWNRASTLRSWRPTDGCLAQPLLVAYIYVVNNIETYMIKCDLFLQGKERLDISSARQTFWLQYDYYNYNYYYWCLLYIDIDIYLLTAIGLTPGGSTHLHINNTQNITINNKTTRITKQRK
jgi:hypothetical protein